MPSTVGAAFAGFARLHAWIVLIACTTISQSDFRCRRIAHHVDSSFPAFFTRLGSQCLWIGFGRTSTPAIQSRF